MKRVIFYLISVPIILLLVVMLLPAISGGHPTRQQKCTIEMRFISDALQQSRKETGRYPTEQPENILQQLRATNALGSQYLLYPFRKGHYLGSGKAESVIAEAGLDGASQFNAIRIFIDGRQTQKAVSREAQAAYSTN